ncbi:MAG TPA: DUF3536 domain-containing protein [Myxococcota bacterium]
MSTDADRLLCCIHGHFYQPPRENPWLEELEREESAAPHHDWNARITEECYAPKAWARVLDDQARVTRLYSNYTRLGFNIGPTLTSWLGRHAPATLAAIVRADAAAVEGLGHGNAIAQVYNHIIMPLANERDKYTQVRWGKRAFAETFGREPRGMWLAETAIDAATVEVLADEDIAFTILSPFQAARYRLQNDDGGWGDWVDCGDGSIPTGRAYKVNTESGKSIAAFFYDAGIAKGVAFEGLLSDAGNLIGALHRVHDQRVEHGGARPGEPWLVHTATDGESYGHHFRFGEMALAAAYARLEDDPTVEMINHATFLERHGVRAEVELHPVSAWSCSHGVGRWERDCGCKMSHHPATSQAWRGGLRHALNDLRDGLAVLFEREGAALLRDPWAARDGYIDVVLDRSRTDAFLAEHVVEGREQLRGADRDHALRLLEMQRCAMLMFTSCGWFFDDVSGPEGVILLRYAARAISLARGVDAAEADRLEGVFKATLAEAHSNYRKDDGSLRTGADVYVDDAVTAAMGADRIAVTLALTAGIGEVPPARLAAWRVTEHEERAIDDASVPTVVGRLSLLDERMGEAERIAFVVVGFGGLDWRGVLTKADRFDAIVEKLTAAADTSDVTRVLDDEIADGGRGFSLQDASADVRGEIIRQALARRVDVTDSVVAELLLSERALLRGAVALGGKLSPSLRGLVSHALARRAKDIVEELGTVAGSAAPLTRRLKTVLDDARGFGVTLDLTELVRLLESGAVAAIERAASMATTDPDASRAAVVRANRLLTVMPLVAPPDRQTWRLMQAGSELVERAAADDAVRAVARSVLAPLDTVCKSAFAERLAA